MICLISIYGNQINLNDANYNDNAFQSSIPESENFIFFTSMILPFITPSITSCQLQYKVTTNLYGTYTLVELNQRAENVKVRLTFLNFEIRI